MHIQSHSFMQQILTEHLLPCWEMKLKARLSCSLNVYRGQEAANKNACSEQMTCQVVLAIAEKYNRAREVE